MDERGELNQIENRFMLTGGTSVESARPNPAPQWLTDKSWCTIMEMAEKIPHFEGFDKDFEDDIGSWERIYNSAVPHKIEEIEWPGKYNEESVFHRIMILRILRPDKIIPAIQDLI
jgi:dynein heavy chain